MNFEIYCDESRPELFFTNKEKQAKYLLIGGVWLTTEKRYEFKEQLNKIKEAHKAFGEIKWNKVSNSKIAFYNDLIDFFISKGDELRFRAIVVDSKKVDFVHYHEDDEELGFYKFYYQLIHHWILDFNEYSIFCDTKTNRKGDRLKILQRCLNRANLSSNIKWVQAIPSHESVLMQLTDLLLGAVSARLNQSLEADSAKDRLVSHLENSLEINKLVGTSKNVQKFNIFIIDLKGGW